MDSTNFNHVPADGFVAFAQTLETDAWQTIDATPYLGLDQVMATSPLDVPAATMYKVQLLWCIDALERARAGARSVKEVEADWDNTQRRLKSRLDAAAVHPDANKRAAAARLKKSLLLGRGLQQTRLGFQQEVDFGRQQVATVSSGQGAADVALLDLGDVITELAQATDALAEAVAHGRQARTPSEHLQASLVACRATFAAVANALAWLGHAAPTDAEARNRAAKLHAPLAALAARYPATRTGNEAPAADQPADDASAEAGAGA